MSKTRLVSVFSVFFLFSVITSPVLAKDLQRYIAVDLFSLSFYTKNETMISVESGTYSDQKNGTYESVQTYLKPTNIYFPSQCFDTVLKAFKQDPESPDKRLALVFDLGNITKDNDHLVPTSEEDAPEGSTRGSFLRIASCDQVILEPDSKFSTKP